jgi:putative peptidoglycan lipid II flippase
VSLVRPTLIVGAGTVAARILGLLRDVLFAQVLGAGPVADAFLAAFRLPNIVRRVLSEGGLNPALVPALTRLDRDEAASVAGVGFSNLALALLGLVAAVELSAGLAILVLAPGLADDDQILALAALCTRLAFPMVAGVTLASFVAAVLNRHRRFTAAILAPLVMNAVLVGALLAIGAGSLALPDRAAWLSGAASLAGFVQLAWLGRAFFGPRPLIRLRAPRRAPVLPGMLRTALLTLVAGGAFQLLVLIGTQAASFLPSGVSWLYYADRVVQLPLSIVSAIVGIVLLPELAARHVAGEHAALVLAQNRALELGVIVALPAAAALAILSEPISSVLFQRGAFGPGDAQGTAAALRGLSVGLPFAVAGKILTQTLFARGETAPALIALATALAAAALGALALVPILGIGGVGAAIALGALVHAGALAVALRAFGLWRMDLRLASRLLRSALATAIMGIGLHVLLAPLESAGVAGLATLCLVGLALYAGAAWLFGAVTRADLADLRKSR